MILIRAKKTLINILRRIKLIVSTKLIDHYKLELKEIEKQLPSPTQKEAKLIKAFRCKINKRSKDSEATTSNLWKTFTNDFSMHVINYDPRTFFHWRSVKQTMFMVNPPYAHKMFLDLSNDKHWNTHWKLALSETNFGAPIRYSNYPDTTSNSVIHTFHIYQLFTKTTFNISSVSRIFEFGGGYGNMCRIFRTLGFTGEYIIYDLPEFLFLQEFYLGNLGFDVLEAKTNKVHLDTNILVSKLEDLEDIFEINASTLFLATWSLSEVPLNLRNLITSIIGKCDYYLFGYQKTFEEVDNLEYFINLTKNASNVQWENWYYPDFNGYYLVGQANKEKK